MARLARGIVKLLNLVGYFFTVRDLLAIFFGGGASTVTSTFASLHLPLWLSIIAPVLVFLLTAAGLAWILGGYKRKETILKLPTILKHLNDRLGQLAYKYAEKLKNRDLTAIGEDMLKLYKLKKYEQEIRSGLKLKQRTEKRIAERLEGRMKADFPNFLKDLVALTDKHQINLIPYAKKDFLYSFHQQQLDNFIVPDLEISQEIHRYLDYSQGLNTILMLQQATGEGAAQRVSLEIDLAQRKYNMWLKESMEDLLARVRMKIDNYLEKTNERKGKQ
jgi:hypothetical protein